MKKLLGFLTAMLMVLTLSACTSPAPGPTPEGTEGTDGDRPVLGIVMPNATHGFLGESIKHAEDAAKTFADEYNLDYKFLKSS